MIVDELYIGSGPLNCLAAVRSVEQGKTVRILDRRKRPFGAWGTVGIDGTPMEIGCHIWSRVPACYHFLEIRLDMALEELRPAPMLITDKGDLHYDRKWLPYNLKRLYTKLRRNPADLGKLVQSASFRLPIIPRSYSYPEKGAVELDQALEKLLDKHGISLELENDISELVWKDHHWTVNGELKATRVFLTSTSQLKHLSSDGQEVQLSHERQDFYHIHMKLAKPLEKAFSYWRVMGHESIHRISDISHQLPEGDEGVMILFGVHASAMDKGDDALCQQALELLKSRGITSDNEVLSMHSNHFPVDRLDQTSLEKLNTLPNLEVIHSTDLMFGLFELLKKGMV